MNKIKALVILILLISACGGSATEITAQLHLIKTAFDVDHQTLPVQMGIVQGTIQFNGDEQLVWATLKSSIGFIQGSVFQTATQTWRLEVSLTPQQLTLLEQTLKIQVFNLLSVCGEYQTLENAPYEVIFDWTKILNVLKTNPVNTLKGLHLTVDHLVRRGAIQFSEAPNDMAKQAVVFILRRQLFEYYQIDGQLAIRLRYPIPQQATRTFIHSPAYVEQVSLFPVEVRQQTSTKWTESAYRVQTVKFYIDLELKPFSGIRLIALQSEIRDHKGYRQPGQVLPIQKPNQRYSQTFSFIHDSKSSYLVYWGKIFLENGSVINLPKIRQEITGFIAPNIELNSVVSSIMRGD
ncbi:MAG: hypothetical protein VSS75_005820 [Candidatus Parabeggiatoa sp.]|nr:hypothetical protein [Candidatus Parabeggiatoa sp.]